MQPTRETFGNIPAWSQTLFYVLALVAMAIFTHGLWRRYRLWRQGQPIGLWPLIARRARDLSTHLRPRFGRLLSEGLGQKRVRGRGLPSWAHGLLFAGFMMLFLGTVLLEIDHLGSGISDKLKFHQGVYYVIYEFTLDVFGLLFLAGCVLFFWRRLNKPSSVGHRVTDWYVLIVFLLIGLTGYLVEGLRMVWQQPTGLGAKCSPVGLMVSSWFSGLGPDGARPVHLAVWWFHAVLVFGFIAWIPYTRLLHIIVGPLNLFLANPGLGRLEPLAIEEVEATERIGVSRITHFNRQQLVSMDACMECGRCDDACPALASGKPLSPKGVVQDLRRVMSGLERPVEAPDGGPLHGEIILPETLWACTACTACVRVCPVRVDPLTLITDLRRNLVGEGTLSGTAATALRRMQSSGNPWGLAQVERGRWSEGLDVPTVQENPKFEVLYWIGCAGSYDRRAQRVARAVVKMLTHARVNYAILGREEKCTGESARRLGDEFLFQELAQANIATLGKYGVRKILTHCPHCLNSLVKDYSQFGGHYEVMHHSQFFEQLLAEKRIILPKPASAPNSAALSDPTSAAPSKAGAVTYHDPCYLARVNRIHQPPRDVLQASLAVGNNPASFVEIPRNREKTSCCGAGGGRMWMEEDPKQRVSTQRSREALATGATTVAVGCPFCLTMITDGVKAQGSEETRVLDLAEILVERLGI